MIDIDARHAQVLGDGPRLTPLPVEAISDDLHDIMARMTAISEPFDSRDSIAHLVGETAGAVVVPDMEAELAKLPEIIPTMLRHPDLFKRQTDLGIQLLINGALSARDREMVILRVAWLSRAPYEWGEHVLVAKQTGMTGEDIARIIEGPDAAGWTEHERAMLTAVAELLADATISDATWAILARTLDDRQLIELPVVVGVYQCTAYYQNALRLRLHPGNDGLHAR